MGNGSAYGIVGMASGLLNEIGGGLCQTMDFLPPSRRLLCPQSMPISAVRRAFWRAATGAMHSADGPPPHRWRMAGQARPLASG